jgi:hypothetical protein
MTIESPMQATHGSGQSSGPAAAPAGTRRGYVHARAVGTYVPKLTRKAFEKFGFSAATLLTDWVTIVGVEVAGYTAPERLKWPREVHSDTDGETGAEGRPGAVLVLRVDPARALDVEYKGRQIIERINGYFGYRAIAELRLLQAPLAKPAKPQDAPPPAPLPRCEAPELATIADERLRAALGRLKSGLMARAPAAG